MKIKKLAAVIAVLSTTAFVTMSLIKQPEKTSINTPQTNFNTTAKPTATPKIQAAILLDVSNSMDGLIEQAKAQLWNMVSVMGKAECNNAAPVLEIALYEYGRTSNDAKKGYVKQISGFTGDLDKLSQKLFDLKTYGGDEYCGHVIYSSVEELNWDPSEKNYKVIFIAGNEDFLQGDVPYSRACSEAAKKGVIVNTIYCGDRLSGIKEHWNLTAECNGGSYTNINQNEKVIEIPTPYDSTIFALNGKLNNTYVFYGENGASGYLAQESTDKQNYALSKTAAAKRVAVKGEKGLYKNDSWDLVDATEKDAEMINKIDLKTLPPALKNKSRKEVEVYVKSKNEERKQIQKEIVSINNKREEFIKTEKQKTGKVSATLESEVEKIIRVQAKKYNMVIK